MLRREPALHQWMALADAAAHEYPLDKTDQTDFLLRKAVTYHRAITAA